MRDFGYTNGSAGFFFSPLSFTFKREFASYFGRLSP